MRSVNNVRPIRCGLSALGDCPRRCNCTDRARVIAVSDRGTSRGLTQFRRPTRLERVKLTECKRDPRKGLGGFTGASDTESISSSQDVAVLLLAVRTDDRTDG